MREVDDLQWVIHIFFVEDLKIHNVFAKILDISMVTKNQNKEITLDINYLFLINLIKIFTITHDIYIL